MNQAYGIANHPARVLAGIIDYLAVAGLYIALSGILPDLPSGLVAFLSGAAYFGIAQSRIAKGQTIGKALLSLAVVPFPLAADGPRCLSLSRSLVRYFLTYGILILAAEAPPALYREAMVVAPSWQLELNMLFAFSWFVANLAHILVDPAQRGFHDLIAGSQVVRLEHQGAGAHPAPQHTFGPAARYFPVCAAALVWLPWWLGIQRPPPVESVMQARYPLERELDIRVLNAQAAENGVLIEALLLDADRMRGREGQKAFGEKAISILRTVHSLPESAQQIRFRLYADPREEPLTKTGEPLEVLAESGNPPTAEPSK